MKKVLNFFVGIERKKYQKIVIIVIYFLAAILFNFKIYETQSVIEMFADEPAHIAYIAYLEKTGKIIPEFKDMKLLEGDLYTQNNRFDEDTVNYLGHPPLYYHIMRIFNVVEVDGENVNYDVGKIRLVSQFISNIALILAFYIGYKNIKSVLASGIYSFFLVSVPLLTYVAGAIQNDVLSFFGVNIFIIGMLKFVRKERNYATYIIIAMGTLICMLNKLTVGLVIGISYIIIFIYTIIKEKSFKCIFCKQFLVTLPIYLPILIYYLIIISRYGTVNPSLPNIAPEYFKTTTFYNGSNDRYIYSFGDYAKIYWQNFVRYWGGVDKTIGSIYSDMNKAKPAIIIFFLPILYFVVQKMEKQKINIVYYAIYIAVLIAIGVQFYKAWYEFKNISGYWGGYQSRYYVCCMVPFAYLFSMVFEALFNLGKEEKEV